MTDTIITIPRHRKILDMVRAENYISNEQLARELDVTVQTIRRDLNFLSAHGFLARHHGGASSVAAFENIAYRQRQVLNARAKQGIAAYAAAMIPDNTSLFINIGTTTEAFARALMQHHDLRVITNNLHVASALSRHESFEVFIAGGRIRRQDGGIVGAEATQSLTHFRTEIGVIGISGIDEDGALLDYDLEEVQCARAIIRNARRVMLLTDHTKFSRTPMGRVGQLRDIDDLVTDAPPPENIRKLLEASGVTLHVVKS